MNINLISDHCQVASCNRLYKERTTPKSEESKVNQPLRQVNYNFQITTAM